MKGVFLLLVVCAAVGFANSDWRYDVRNAQREARMARVQARIAAYDAVRQARVEAREAAREARIEAREAAREARRAAREWRYRTF